MGGSGLDKVLITGGAGFVGYHLARRLLGEHCKVTLCDNLFRGKRDATLKQLLLQPNVKFVVCDLSQPSQLARLGKGFDFVYHLAAINGTRFFYEIPDRILRDNLLSTINLLDWAVKAKPGKLIFTSSSETYTSTIDQFGWKIPTTEEVPLCVSDISNPRFSYGVSKIAGESLFHAYGSRHDLPFTIVRLHNIYGPRMGFEHVIPQLIERIQQKENPFHIHGWDNTRSFCFIDDVVQALVALADTPKSHGRTVNVGDDREEIRILDLSRKLFGIAGFRPHLVKHPAPKGSVKRRCPDIRLLKRLTGFRPQVRLDEGIHRTFEWYAAHPRKGK